MNDKTDSAVREAAHQAEKDKTAQFNKEKNILPDKVITREDISKEEGLNKSERKDKEDKRSSDQKNNTISLINEEVHSSEANTFLPGSNSSFDSIVSSKGTSTGLLIKVEGSYSRGLIKKALQQFIAVRKKFLTGNSVSVEWCEYYHDIAFLNQVYAESFFPHGIEVQETKLTFNGGETLYLSTGHASKNAHGFNSRSNNSLQNNSSQGSSLFKSKLIDIDKARKTKNRAGEKGEEEVPSLFGGLVDPLSEILQEPPEKASDQPFHFDYQSSAWDMPDGRIINSTLRSGQRIETEYTLLVLGDVNSGAEIVAGGDIIVLGTLRGVAHAGAFDENGGGRVIFALNLQPSQLRIGAIISRGDTQLVASYRKENQEVMFTPEVARVDGQNIVVEYFNARSSFTKGIKPLLENREKSAL
jgi:septum formation inhibitor MinC